MYQLKFLDQIRVRRETHAVGEGKKIHEGDEGRSYLLAGVGSGHADPTAKRGVVWRWRRRRLSRRGIRKLKMMWSSRCT